MSKVNSFAYGEVSGKFGNTVGAVDKKGRTTMREYRAPGDPKTESQVSQRTKFGFINTELSFMRRMYKNTFVSYIAKEDLRKASWMAVKNAITGTYPDFTLDYTKLIVAKGSLPRLEQVMVTIGTDTTVNLTWDTTQFLGVDPSDKVKMVFVNPETKLWLLSDEEAVRSEGSMAVTLPAAWKGATIHCWAFTITAQKKYTSNSQYLNTLQL